jgi:hypothetical protein
MWLVGISIGRSPYYGPAFGLLISGGMLAGLGWRAYLTVPALLARNDVTGHVSLASLAFVSLVVLCAVGLLVRGLFTPVAVPSSKPETSPHSLVFDM